ncbi:MAG TPA: phenylalanine--tRNA ligase subunit beta [Anaerolineales bacterium]|nr:phenylalanine--tRNA ligase subunit beta [Anaerolineales bacterium]
MLIPLSWLREFVDVDLPPAELAHRLTLAGLEVEALRYVGLAFDPQASGLASHAKVTGLAWDPDKIVVGAIREVMPHPNADRLVLCRLEDGQQEHVVLTGAPNLFPYKGKGPLETPVKVAYAREGARIYDGHQPGQNVMTLRRAKIRGVESYSMACSEKELGISDDHEGVIVLDDDAPVGRPLAEYMGDVVFDIALTPNMARNACVVGVAREVAALTGQTLRLAEAGGQWKGKSLKGRVRLEIRQPELNPRFVLGLIEGVGMGPSPYPIQLRLRLAGMRPINNIVDATNYVMLEVGQPLHAFDFDALVKRAKGGVPRIHTRTAQPGERLTTLDGVERILDDFTVLVCDEAGALSIAGVMGGAETEVGPQTRNVLLEGAAWDFINIRRTSAAQRLSSEAAYRFSRGVHPALAETGVRHGLALMQRLAGGDIAADLVDVYPRPAPEVIVDLEAQDVERALGLRLAGDEVAQILRRLEFKVETKGNALRVTTPPHRLDIGTGLTGVADLVEEVARIYGYDRIPESLLADNLPVQRNYPLQEREAALADVLVGLGLQEVIGYRMTTPERDAAAGEVELSAARVHIANPIASDRTVMRRSVLSSVLEIVERNLRLRNRIAVFEIGPVYQPVEGAALPEEIPQLVIVLTGPRQHRGWQEADEGPMDFFDLKGLLAQVLEAMHVSPVDWKPAEHASFHPGKSAEVFAAGRRLGRLGELHPTLRSRYELGEAPVMAAVLDLRALLESSPANAPVTAVPAYPPVLEDLAIIVSESVAAGTVEAALRQAGGDLLTRLQLFDVYRGDQIGEGKKSLAYSLVYQAPDRTLTDEEIARVRAGVVAHLEKELGAKLRS